MEEAFRHVLLINCPDQPGLIHTITGVLFRHALNITENNEYVDRTSQVFFMRTEVAGSFTAEALLDELKEKLPAGAELELRAQTPKRLVILGTKEPHCVGDLLLRHASGELKAEILAVVSQYDTLGDLVRRFDIPFHPIAVDEKSREQHEAELEKVIALYQPDLLVLAKYMRVLSPSFVSRYRNRIINIHHSFLPAFIGKNPYAQAYERGVKIIGATAHFVNERLDEGPIITQSVIPISHTQDARALARSGKDVEQMVLAKALSLVLENRVIVQGQRTLVFE
jgi:formyltetrahydrofolate deformylase